MQVLFNFVFLIVGLMLILWGADRFTDGASGLARKWNVSELVIGLTIVAFGTSLPEFMVSFLSSLRGSGDMSVGNILGSNIFNSLMIVGVSSLSVNLIVSRGILYRDLPFLILISVVLAWIGMCGSFTRWSAMILLVLFVAFLSYNIYIGRKQPEFKADENQKTFTYSKLAFLLFLGMGCLVGGGKLAVGSATELARTFGVSERIIGLTILSGGTSLPELAASFMAARKGSCGLALGNVVGSNVFNICFVLGVCNMISPMAINSITMVDWMMLVSGVVLLWFVCLTSRAIVRWEGFMLILVYLCYLFYLLH